MQTLKFRAWDKTLNEMRDVLSIDFEVKGVDISDLNDPKMRTILRSFDDVVLMQFTGLLDKNGKEIFEGDIVKGSFIEDNYYKIPIEGIVSFFNGSFCVSNPYAKEGFICILENERHSKFEIEVTGNIYERTES